MSTQVMTMSRPLSFSLGGFNFRNGVAIASDAMTKAQFKALQTSANNVNPARNIKVDGIIGPDTLTQVKTSLGIRAARGSGSALFLVGILSVADRQKAVRDLANNPSRYIDALGGSMPQMPDEDDDDAPAKPPPKSDDGSLVKVIAISAAATVGVLGLIIATRR